MLLVLFSYSKTRLSRVTSVGVKPWGEQNGVLQSNKQELKAPPRKGREGMEQRNGTHCTSNTTSTKRRLPEFGESALSYPPKPCADLLCRKWTLKNIEDASLAQNVTRFQEYVLHLQVDCICEHLWKDPRYGATFHRQSLTWQKTAQIHESNKW